MNHASARSAVVRSGAVLALGHDDEVLAGLRAPRKRLPGWLRYADAGAELFARLARLDAYYPAHAERALLDHHLPQLAYQVGPHARVLEPGPGDARRTRALLDALDAPSGYVAIDLARAALDRRVAQLRAELPAVDVQAVVADCRAPFEVPIPQHGFRRTLAFFPGSAIGELEPGEARAVLARLGALAGDDRLLLLGADATRDPDLLRRAYDDDHGAAAALARNALAHLNRTRGATFELDAFAYRAGWNADASRVELQLVSARRQVVEVGGVAIALAAGEPIAIAHAYKHAPAAMHALLAGAGWRPRQVFTAREMPFRLWLCEPIARDR